MYRRGWHENDARGHVNYDEVSLAQKVEKFMKRHLCPDIKTTSQERVCRKFEGQLMESIFKQ